MKLLCVLNLVLSWTSDASRLHPPIWRGIETNVIDKRVTKVPQNMWWCYNLFLTCLFISMPTLAPVLTTGIPLLLLDFQKCLVLLPFNTIAFCLGALYTFLINPFYFMDPNAWSQSVWEETSCPVFLDHLFLLQESRGSTCLCQEAGV